MLCVLPSSPGCVSGALPFPILNVPSLACCWLQQVLKSKFVKFYTLLIPQHVSPRQGLSNPTQTSRCSCAIRLAQTTSSSSRFPLAVTWRHSAHSVLSPHALCLCPLPRMPRNVFAQVPHCSSLYLVGELLSCIRPAWCAASPSADVWILAILSVHMLCKCRLESQIGDVWSNLTKGLPPTWRTGPQFTPAKRLKEQEMTTLKVLW